jgi:hypothetical protein
MQELSIQNLHIHTIIMGIEAIVNHNMRLTRMATPKLLREAASKYTGKTYPKSRNGLISAHADMLEFQANLQR